MRYMPEGKHSSMKEVDILFIEFHGEKERAHKLSLHNRLFVPHHHHSVAALPGIMFSIFLSMKHGTSEWLQHVDSGLAGTIAAEC